MHMLFQWCPSRRRLIPHVDPHSVWHGDDNRAVAFQNPFFGVSDIVFFWPSSHLFVLFLQQEGSVLSVQSSGIYLSNRTVVLHMMSHFSDTPHTNTSQINKYFFRALGWFVQLPDIYLSVYPWDPLISTCLKLNSLSFPPPDVQLFLQVPSQWMLEQDRQGTQVS